MALCNVNTLMADAACFACQSSGVLQILELQLLCEILNQHIHFYGGFEGPNRACSDTNPVVSSADLDRDFPRPRLKSVDYVLLVMIV